MVTTILEKLNESYDFSENEQMIVIYMLEHLEDIPHLSSREFAKRTYTSATSIIRFVRKLGYQHYNDFKYNIVSMMKNIDLGNNDVLSNEDILSLSQKINQLEISALQKTKECLSLTDLQAVIQDISTKDIIDIYAYDTNAKIAEYAAHLLSNMGKFVQVYQETDLQINHALHVKSDHVVFIISKHARNTYLLDIAKTLYRRRIPLIVITQAHSNDLCSYAQFVLHTPFETQAQKINELIFFTSVKYIFDLIYALLFSMSYDKSERYEALYNQIFFKKL